MNKKGFTLIELLAVIVILGIVVAIAIPGINSVISNSRQKSVLAEANIIHSAAIRKLSSNPGFDFKVINKNNIKEYLETDGTLYDYIYISNNNNVINVNLKKSGLDVNTNGKEISLSSIEPHVAFEYDFSLGAGYLNIKQSDLDNQNIYVYQGTYLENKNNIEKGFKNTYKIYNNISGIEDLRDRLGSSGIYTIIATKMSATYGYSTTEVTYFNRALINIPHFDLKGLNTTSLHGMFFGATSFNQDINHWDTSGITSLHSLFRGATLFNKDLNSWNTSKVTTMTYAFLGASSFNSNISSWDTSSVWTMRYMFASADNFNSDLSNWNVSKVRDMTAMFSNTPFNQDIGGWDTSSVLKMGEEGKPGMFLGAKDFNQDIGNWNVSNVDTMYRMFYGASSFNQDLSRWDVKKISVAPIEFDRTTPSWTKAKPIWGNKWRELNE